MGLLCAYRLVESSSTYPRGPSTVTGLLSAGLNLNFAQILRTLSGLDVDLDCKSILVSLPSIAKVSVPSTYHHRGWRGSPLCGVSISSLSSDGSMRNTRVDVKHVCGVVDWTVEGSLGVIGLVATTLRKQRSSKISTKSSSRRRLCGSWQMHGPRPALVRFGCARRLSSSSCSFE